MNNVDKQRGMTTIGWLIVLFLVGFFALVLVRLAPAYLEYFSVASTLEALKKEPFIAGMSTPEIREKISRRFDVNDIDTLKHTDVRIERRGGRLLITAEYEVRSPLVANVDVVTSFLKQVEIPLR
ncbi:MAG: DUF4845 domain-containing protein [Gammaproteobacteria bacterium]